MWVWVCVMSLVETVAPENVVILRSITSFCGNLPHYH